MQMERTHRMTFLSSRVDSADVCSTMNWSCITAFYAYDSQKMHHLIIRY